MESTPIQKSAENVKVLPRPRISELPTPKRGLSSFTTGCKISNLLTSGLAPLIKSVCCCSKVKYDLVSSCFILFVKSPDVLK